jgi:hypothetical protein
MRGSQPTWCHRKACPVCKAWPWRIYDEFFSLVSGTWTMRERWRLRREAKKL